MKKILDHFELSIPYLIFEKKQISFFKNQVRGRDFSQQRRRPLPILEPDILCHKKFDVTGVGKYVQFEIQISVGCQNFKNFL